MFLYYPTMYVFFCLFLFVVFFLAVGVFCIAVQVWFGRSKRTSVSWDVQEDKFVLGCPRGQVCAGSYSSSSVTMLKVSQLMVARSTMSVWESQEDNWTLQTIKWTMNFALISMAATFAFYVSRNFTNNGTPPSRPWNHGTHKYLLVVLSTKYFITKMCLCAQDRWISLRNTSGL